MSKRILIGCYEIPNYGGASTSGYKLFEMMQEDGFDVYYVNIIDEEDKPYYMYMFGENWGNPKALDNVYNCSLTSKLFYPSPEHPELVSLIREISPDIMLGIGYIAALLMKMAAVQKKMIFYTAGCQQAFDYVEGRKNTTLQSLNKHIIKSYTLPEITHEREKDTVRVSDLIVTHSEIIRSLYIYYFPNHAGKIYPDPIWKAEWIYNGTLEYSESKKPFENRDIDLLFVASSWQRPIKNYELAKKISLQFKGLNVHFVGEFDKKHNQATYHGLVVNREELFEIMGNSKIILSTSRFDPAPGILYEASAMGCNIIASKNCGNWQICNEDLLVDDYKLEEFAAKISIALTKKLDDNIEYFLNTNSYKNLIEIFQVI